MSTLLSSAASAATEAPLPKASAPAVAVIVPVFNEAQNLPALQQRLAAVLPTLQRPYRIWYVDDGSSDRSLEILKEISAADPTVSVIELTRNFGQHAAILAGFASSDGDIIVTLDADLQNPPEEIPKLIAAIDDGYEVVGTWRQTRHDPFFRRFASRIINHMTAIAVGVRMRDYGCMLRAYRRNVVQQIVDCDERSSFIPALANSLARRSIEIPVSHAERFGGTSKYGILRLMRLSFDLVTGFSLLPIQMVSVSGIVVALLGFGFGIFLLVRRFFVGPEVEGVFTLFAILFVFLGLLIFALGVVGEYVGRIYLEVRRRPTYRIRAVHTRCE
jgi:undecaprenyl-phosphate 4-deoxy-4-formamido-L-arabinose transferase